MGSLATGGDGTSGHDSGPGARREGREPTFTERSRAPEEQRALDTLYGGHAAAPASGPLYALETMMRDTLRTNETKLAHRTGATEAQLAAERAAFCDTMAKAGLGGHVGIAELLHTRWTAARMAAAQPDHDVAALEARVAADAEATRVRLDAQWGADYETRVTRFEAWKAANPDLKTILDTDGVGLQPDVAAPLVEEVWRMNYK